MKGSNFTDPPLEGGLVQATDLHQVKRIVRKAELRTTAGVRVEFLGSPMTVGRAESADVVLSDSLVSSLHFELRAGTQGVVLRDLGSRNGTFLGACRVTEVELIGPCVICVGQTELHFAPLQESGSESEPVPALLQGFGPLVGKSPKMQELYTILSAVSASELSVLITGETGTGKELVARAIHEASPRKGGPFVVVDCAALPSTLAESILFGHEKGAFTGATSSTQGAFLAANSGTLFLDELGELPEELQPKLLRAIAERSIQRVGRSGYERVDVRFIAATRRDLRREMNARRFREDLFFRLGQVRVEVPPLRERLSDIPALVSAVCERLGQVATKDHVLSHLMHRFRSYDWPGNVRELVNVASVLSSLGEAASPSLLSHMLVRQDEASGEEAVSSAEEFVLAKRHFEERYFRALLDETGGNISEIARRCGLARHQVRGHLKKLGLAE